MKDHRLSSDHPYQEILVQKRPALDSNQREIEGLYNYWILLNNPKQLNAVDTRHFDIRKHDRRQGISE